MVLSVTLQATNTTRHLSHHGNPIQSRGPHLCRIRSTAHRLASTRVWCRSIIDNTSDSSGCSPQTQNAQKRKPERHIDRFHGRIPLGIEGTKARLS